MVVTDVALPRPPGGRVRVGVWVGHMALPVLALWLLVTQPDLDIQWQHRPGHFWLVMTVAAVNVALAFLILRAARLREDARLLLAGYGFMLAAGFLLLHALATPGVIVGQPNTGFEIATPVGLALASVLFAASSIELSSATSQRIVSWDPYVKWTLVAIMVGWGVVSLAELPPLSNPIPEQGVGPLRWVAVAAIVLYLAAAVAFYRTHRRKPSVMLVALITASVLLAEAMFTIVYAARNWHLSWWLWHILMAAAFGFVAYSAYTQYRREGASSGIFDGIVSRETADILRHEYSSALETLTDTLERAAQTGTSDEELELIVAGLGSRFALTEGQTEVLGRAARALATERTQARRLGALAHIATETWVERNEDELLAEVITVVGERFAPDVIRIGLNTDQGLSFPDRLGSGGWPEDAARHSKQLVVGGETAGVVEFARPAGQFQSRDLAIMETLVAGIGIALENVRLYAQLDSLFRTYLPTDVANTLREDPSRAGLGGSMAEVTVLFADLRGFTTFSEGTDPTEVTELLNRYFGIVVPSILSNGGTAVQFVGDALLAVFDLPEPQPGHELRAAQTGLEMQELISIATEGDTAAPRFRIGINTGMVLVGNIGSDQFRSFSVVGDPVNTASRLEAVAEPGTVVLGESTYRAIADRVEVTSLGAQELRGKELPITAYRLERILS